MRKNAISPEILAPCGSMEAVVAAAECGADAVYIGGKVLSARRKAQNFSADELREVCDFCHLRGMRVYQTVNTLVFDEERELLLQTATEACAAGVDALIVQDVGAARLLRQVVPTMPLHASTQMSIHTAHGAAAAEAMGFQRFVAARELSHEEIAAIAAATPLETEVFVHGALCMCVSGQCFMSAMLGGRSGNRGLCAQPCRLNFSADRTQRDEYALSLKDMSVLPHLRELAAMGVRSFKIEGRMKRPEYVAAAVTAAKAAISGEEPDMETLQAVFSRAGFTEGYYRSRMGTEMFGIRAREDVVSAQEVLPGLRELYAAPRKRADIDFTLELTAGEPAALSAACEGITVTALGAVPQLAQNRPTDEEGALRQLGKLGDTIYNVGSLTLHSDGTLMLPASALNALRREASAKLDAARISAATPKHTVQEVDAARPVQEARPAKQQLRADFASFSQLAAVDIAALVQLSLPLAEVLAHTDALLPYADKVLVSLPRLLFGVDTEEQAQRELAGLQQLGFSHLYCHNLAHLMLARELSMTAHGGFGLNIANSDAVEALQELGLCDATLSIELKLTQAQRIAAASPIPTGIVAYGHSPLMLTRNCPVGGAHSCKSCKHVLTDRIGRTLPILCGGDPHRYGAQVLNADVLYLADRLREIAAFDFLSLLFTQESPQECADILTEYREGGIPTGDFTRGLYYRGVL